MSLHRLDQITGKYYIIDGVSGKKYECDRNGNKIILPKLASTPRENTPHKILFHNIQPTIQSTLLTSTFEETQNFMRKVSIFINRKAQRLLLLSKAAQRYVQKAKGNNCISQRV